MQLKWGSREEIVAKKFERYFTMAVRSKEMQLEMIIGNKVINVF